MKKYRALWALKPSLIQSLTGLRTKFFLSFLIIIFACLIISFYYNSIISSKKHLSSVTSTVNNFFEQQLVIMKYIGKSILNSNSEDNIDKISKTLNDFQNIYTISTQNNFVNQSNLIWIKKNGEAIGAFGLLNKEIFRVDELYLNQCKTHTNSILFSKPYIDNILTNLEYVDACLAFNDANDNPLGILVIHYDISELANYLFSPAIDSKFKQFILDKNFIPIISAANQDLSKDPYPKIEKHAVAITKQGLFSHLSSHPYMQKISNTQYSVLVVPENNYLTLLNLLINYSFYLTALFFIISFVTKWYSNFFTHSALKIFQKILNQNSQRLKDNKLYLKKHNYSFLSYFSCLTRNNIKIHNEINRYKSTTMILENKLIEKSKFYSIQKEELNKKTELSQLIKHYFHENTKFKKVVSEHMRSCLLNIITETEMLNSSDNSSLDVTFSKTKKNAIVNSINVNLKNIYNLNIKSIKEMFDPVIEINKAIAFVMIHAILRNIEVKTQTKNIIDKVFVNKLKFQLIIAGIVFQSIDTTPAGGTIFIEAKESVIKNESFLEILVKDNSYQNYQDLKTNVFMSPENISLETIKSLIDQEGGSLELNHNHKQGKSVRIFFPFGNLRKNHAQPETKNVYQLF